MDALKNNGATHIFRSPENWDTEKYGECHNLEVVVKDDVCYSYWAPTPDELRLLVQGNPVQLAIWGHQPPVSIHVIDLGEQTHKADSE